MLLAEVSKSRNCLFPEILPIETDVSSLEVAWIGPKIALPCAIVCFQNGFTCSEKSDAIYRSKTLILSVFRAKTRNYENFTFQLHFVNFKFLQNDVKTFLC